MSPLGLGVRAYNIKAKACSSHHVRWRAAQDAASNRQGQRYGVLCVRQLGFRGTVQHQSGHYQQNLLTQVPRWQKDLQGKTWFTLQRQHVFEHSPPSLKTSGHRSDRGQARVNFPSSFFLSYKMCSWLDSRSKRNTSVAPNLVGTKDKQFRLSINSHLFRMHSLQMPKSFPKL